MNEDISRLMDGELDDAALERVFKATRRPPQADIAPDALATWVCYHAIGDSLRGTRAVIPGFSTRFARALAFEPTVLAPAPRRRAGMVQPGTWAWGIAATMAAVTVVGWTALSMLDTPPSTVAKVREAVSVRAAQVKPPANVPADYLLAHHEYSPATAIQGVGTYLRAVVMQESEPRP